MTKKFLTNKTKRVIWDTVKNYKKKRQETLADLGVSKQVYAKKVSDLRSKVFDNFEDKLTIAKNNLIKNGFKIYEAEDDQMALEIFQSLLKSNEVIVKSKSNTAREIGLNEKFKEIAETDLGDFIVQLFKEEDQHYVIPAMHITPQAIVQKIKNVYDDEVEPEVEKLTHYLCDKIRQRILKATVGITGANFFTQSGQLVLLENEGNISLVSRLPKKHIVICGIDKLVESIEDATQLCQSAAIFGTGQPITQYVSIISGPSKTADIGNQLVVGAQGAREVHIILLDNGRRELMKDKDFSDLVKCINCGACINFCPIYHQRGKKFGGNYIGAKGIIITAQKNKRETLLRALKKSKKAGSFQCSLCGNCGDNCPMEINLPEMIRKVRQKQNEHGLQSKRNKLMLENIKKTGNPFGENKTGKTPDKLYCC